MAMRDMAPPDADLHLGRIGRSLCDYASDHIPEDIAYRLPAITWDNFEIDEIATFQGLLGSDVIVTVYTHAATKAEAKALANQFYLALFTAWESGTRDADGVYINYVKCSNSPTETRTAGQQAHYYRFRATYHIQVRVEKGN